jgi:hypothetical protein
MFLRTRGAAVFARWQQPNVFWHGPSVRLCCFGRCSFGKFEMGRNRVGLADVIRRTFS